MAYVAFFDANALVPYVVCDLILRLAERGLYRPAWSEAVLDEMSRSLERIHPELGDERLARRRSTMEAKFDYALVTGFEALIPNMPVAKEDRHVAAAAVVARADVLVTSDKRHFPAGALDAFDIQIESPDDFLVDQLTLQPDVVRSEVAEQALSRQRPPVTLEEHLASLGKRVPRFARLLGKNTAPASS
jgi:hypothetical protein